MFGVKYATDGEDGEGGGGLIRFQFHSIPEGSEGGGGEEVGEEEVRM